MASRSSTSPARDITEAHWDAFFAFYMDTGSRKWGRPYLNRRFFSLVGAAMADRILLVMARRAGRYIAGAINFIGDDALYGRNWGAIEEHPFLHFEVCYYQAIDFALARGLKRVEAGAQGEHKLARGYRPIQTYSVHDIADRQARGGGVRLPRPRARLRRPRRRAARRTPAVPARGLRPWIAGVPTAIVKLLVMSPPITFGLRGATPPLRRIVHDRHGVSSARDRAAALLPLVAGLSFVVAGACCRAGPPKTTSSQPATAMGSASACTQAATCGRVMADSWCEAHGHAHVLAFGTVEDVTGTMQASTKPDSIKAAAGDVVIRCGD